MPEFPSGLLVTGDALCSLDPTYGQGMTVAALAALTLRDCLRSGDAQLAQRFFRATARYIGPTWASNQARDRLSSPARERRSVRERLEGAMSRAALNAAAHDITVTERFLRVSNLIDPQSRLRDPALIPRILAVNTRTLFARAITRAATAFVGGAAAVREHHQAKPSTVASR
jgi:flavin-dependent dehydrogenase